MATPTAPDYDNVRYGGPDGIRYPDEVGKATFLTNKNSSGSIFYYTAAGAIPPESSKLVALNGAGALAMTLAAPIAGLPAAGGQDGVTITITAITAHAHTVTTPANKIVPSHDTVTFAAIGDYVTLQALNGLWFPIALGGPTPAIISEV